MEIYNNIIDLKTFHIHILIRSSQPILYTLYILKDMKNNCTMLNRELYKQYSYGAYEVTTTYQFPRTVDAHFPW